jgi:hypothetical protein
MKIYYRLMLLLLAILLAACDGGSKESGKSDDTPSVSDVATQTMKTYTYDWSAICRCHGETATHGKLCTSKGTYAAQHKNESEAIEKMKEDVRKQMNCKDGPFLSFRYETP